MNNQSKIIVAIVLVTLVAFASFLSLTQEDNQPVSTVPPQITQSSNAASQPPLSSSEATEQQLLFLIEEEKLAHDVYTVMYQKYGANVFGNILQSESTHQNRVLVLLQDRDIPDPRSSEIGVFTNTDLQKFYDDLIAQGNISAEEAYKAGVAIEERDIADISTQLATTTDEDIILALEALRSASENHLRAFNRQL